MTGRRRAWACGIEDGAWRHRSAAPARVKLSITGGSERARTTARRGCGKHKIHRVKPHGWLIKSAPCPRRRGHLSAVPDTGGLAFLPGSVSLRGSFIQTPRPCHQRPALAMHRCGPSERARDAGVVGKRHAPSELHVAGSWPFSITAASSEILIAPCSTNCTDFSLNSFVTATSFWR